MRHDVDETFEGYSLAPLSRPIAHGDQDAWARFQQCLEETVLTWLHEHPGRETACRVLSEQHLVALAFERFRQAAVQAQMACETSAEVLVYLRASLHGAILDTLRTLARPGEISRSVPGQVGEPRVENQIESTKIWEILQTLLPGAREQRLAYLLYHCGLGPGEILHCCPQEWADVHEIYRLRCNIVERLLRHADSIRNCCKPCI